MANLSFITGAVMTVATILSVLKCIDGELTEKVTRIQFYMHDQVTGNNATAVAVARPASGISWPTLFGTIVVIDDVLTEGAEMTSKVVGRMQGTYTFSGQEELCVMMSVNVAFHGGEFNGSSVVMLGKNDVMSKVREMAIVGGSGQFRLGRGYALARTHSFNAPNAVVKYVVTVWHAHII